MPLKKPLGCAGCSLETKGYSYTTPVGPISSKILFVGEAAGANEAITGTPFSGPAGYMLNRLLGMVGIPRETVRIDNVVRCQPPNNWLSGAPWEETAIAHCDQYIQQTLNMGHQVVVPLGGIAARKLLGIPQGAKNAGIGNLHGTVTRDALDRFWIVPTFHPSFLQRGATNYIGVVLHDLLVAKEIAQNGFQPRLETLEIDPPVERFRAYADELKQAFKRDPNIWLAVDIETPEKEKGVDEGELEDDPTFEITRINFAYEEDHAVTVPFIGPYVFIIQEILALNIKKAFWNIEYDRPRLIHNDCPVAEPAHDLMWGWHMLQSDIPRGLGFVSPFYSRRPPWKHLSDSNPGQYAAIDAIQTVRCANGIERHLKEQGMWQTYIDHMYDLDRLVLRPIESIGLFMERGDAEKGTGLLGTQKRLQGMLDEISDKLTAIVPIKVIPYEKELKTPRTITDADGNLAEGFEVITRKTMGYVCSKCGERNVPKRHNKLKKGNCQDATLIYDEVEINLWVKRGKFNSASPKQVKDYLKARGYKVPKGKNTDETTDHQALESLRKKHKKDPFFDLIIDDRAIRKLKGTYIDGMLERQDEGGRVHGKYTHAPSTLRLSSYNPNLQNLITDGKKEDHLQLGKMFRECVVASPGHIIVEADFSGIEAVVTGWCAGDPDYIRIAKISPHAYLCSHMVGEPADLSWDDQKLIDYLVGYIKKEKRFKIHYNKAKRVVHGSSYGLTPRGMRLTYPEEFPTVTAAEVLQKLFFEIAPKVKAWQDKTILLADKQHYIGGTSHPFRYKHWFWDAISKRYLKPAVARQRMAIGAKVIEINGSHYEVTLGSDAKRAIAFVPQSIASGILKEVALRLMRPNSEYYIGNLFNGKTPIRMLTHDSITLEVPLHEEDYATKMLVAAMLVPIKQMPLPKEWGLGEHLSIGVEVQRGVKWSEMEDVKVA